MHCVGSPCAPPVVLCPPPPLSCVPPSCPVRPSIVLCAPQLSCAPLSCPVRPSIVLCVEHHAAAQYDNRSNATASCACPVSGVLLTQNTSKTTQPGIFLKLWSHRPYPSAGIVALVKIQRQILCRHLNSVHWMKNPGLECHKRKQTLAPWKLRRKFKEGCIMQNKRRTGTRYLRLYNKLLTGLPQFVQTAPLYLTLNMCTTSHEGRIFQCI